MPRTEGGKRDELQLGSSVPEIERLQGKRLRGPRSRLGQQVLNGSLLALRHDRIECAPQSHGIPVMGTADGASPEPPGQEAPGPWAGIRMLVEKEGQRGQRQLVREK